MIYKKLFYRIYEPQHVGRRIQTVEQIVGNAMLLVDGGRYMKDGKGKIVWQLLCEQILF